MARGGRDRDRRWSFCRRSSSPIRLLSSASASSSRGPTSIASAGSRSRSRPEIRSSRQARTLLISATVRSRFGETSRARPGLARMDRHRWYAEPREDGAECDDNVSGQQAFAVTLPRLTGSLTYRAIVGGDASRRHQIKAIDRPAIASLKAHVEPPAYTKRPAAACTRPGSDRSVGRQPGDPGDRGQPAARAGRIDLAGAGRADGKSSSGPRPSRVVAARARRRLANAGRRPWWPRRPGRSRSSCAINMILSQQPDPARRVVVRPDAPPTLAVAAPDEFKETSPDDFLTVAVAAQDDVAVASAELHYTIERSAGLDRPDVGKRRPRRSRAWARRWRAARPA